MEREVFAANLIRIRKAKGLSAAAVAKLIDVSEEKYLELEMGVATPSANDILKISDALSIPYDELILPNKGGKSKSREVRNGAASVGFNLTTSVMVSIFSIVMLLLYAVPSFYLRYELAWLDVSTSFSFYDFFNGSGSYKAIMAFLLICPVALAGLNLIKLAFPNLRKNTYGKISCVIELALTILFAIIYIILMIKIFANIGDGYIDFEVGGYFVTVFFVIEFITSLIGVIINFKNNKLE